LTVFRNAANVAPMSPVGWQQVELDNFTYPAFLHSTVFLWG